MGATKSIQLRSKEPLRIIGRHQPVQIHEAHEQDEDRDGSEQLEVALQVAREQQREGQREMAEDEREGDVLPAAAQALEIPGNLFGKIARPDDEELRKRKVRPHHDEGQQQLAEVVEVARGEDARACGSR